MRKWLAVFGIVTLAIVSVAYEQHYARERYQAQSENDCVSLAVSTEEQHACAKEAQSRKDYAPWWYILVAWPDGITTWAIIATGFVIAWQSNETRKATDATKDQVKLTRETLVQTQRPKINVRTFYFKHFSDPQEPNGILAGSMLMGQFYIVNLGGTRALVKEIHYEFFITGEPHLPGERPWEGKGGVKYESIFEAGQSKPFVFGREEPLPSGQAFEIFSGRRRLYLMGWIDYVDGLNTGRTTRFCRLYDPVSYRFSAVNDPEYESAD